MRIDYFMIEDFSERINDVISIIVAILIFIIGIFLVFSLMAVITTVR
jgi:hypothetical protein